MTGTFKLPGGAKVRIGSTRRFVAVRPDRDGVYRVFARSDTLATLRGRLRSSTDLIVDTATRSVGGEYGRNWAVPEVPSCSTGKSYE